MPVWMYNEDGATLFEDGDTIPSGFVDSPAKVKGFKEQLPPVAQTDDEPVEDIEALRAVAAELGIKVHHKAKAETIRKQIEEAQ